METITLFETFAHLAFIGWLLLMGYIGGNLLVAWIEEKAREAAKRGDAASERKDDKP